MNQEDFLQKLLKLFLGYDEYEGKSGFIRLVEVRKEYYQTYFKIIKESVEKLFENDPGLKTQVFQNLIEFFSQLFNDTGSLCLRKDTKIKQMISKVVDVSLFYRTNDLYYIKSDKIFKTEEIKKASFNFIFDASDTDYKTNNEKRVVKFKFQEFKDEKIIFKIIYTEGEEDIDYETIALNLKEQDVEIKISTLKAACATYKKKYSKNYDYYLNKHPGEFLEKQLKVWIFQHYIDDLNALEKLHHTELNIFRKLAELLIEGIINFEKKLLKIWQSPKETRKEGYILTLNNIPKWPNIYDLMKKIVTHPNFNIQLQEWKDYGFLSINFKISDFKTKTLNGMEINQEYKNLP